VAVEGISAVGKSATARALADALDGAALLPEAYDRVRPRLDLAVPTRRTLARVERRLFREELLRYREAIGLVRSGRTVIADTAFLGPVTYPLGLAREDPKRDLGRERLAALDRAVRNRTLGVPDLVLWLEAPARTRRRRAGGDPNGRPAALQRRHERVGRWEATLWKRRIAPLLGERFVVVSGRGPTGSIVRRVERALGANGPPPRLAPAEAAARLGVVARALRPRKGIVKKSGRRGPSPRR
jgi:thymidylate kinase